MGTTGLIYVAIVAAWAAYLVPMLLRRNDEAGRRRAAESYSANARVLARQSDGQERARYVVRPASAARADAPGVPVSDELAAGDPSSGDPSPPVRRYVPNRARRVAAMRRRRVLSILTLSLLSVTALAGLAIVPWWLLAIPAALIVAFVVATRVQLRRQARHRAELRAARTGAVFHDHGPAAPPVDAEATVEIKLPAASASVAEPAAATPDPPAEGLWDPVPVTLPTYVMKEKAPDRTVRTISLSGPEVFSSARSADPEPEAAPVVPEPEQVAQEPEELEIRRAVGD
ncbi:MAG TPA: hypothetical protein VFT31_00710 [Kribbella sp.]|nr:hypothetical protein [Kribbella sp.]